MPNMRVIGVLSVVCGVMIVGHAVTGHLGHGDTTIHLENAWARKAPFTAQEGPSGPGAGATSAGIGAVYVTISNRGHEADALLSVASDAATAVELHETVAYGSKIVMRPLPKFDVPSGGKLEMKPGSYHLMLLGLKQDLKPGEIVKVE
jgi:copper(I)-binding protein